MAAYATHNYGVLFGRPEKIRRAQQQLAQDCSSKPLPREVAHTFSVHPAHLSNSAVPNIGLRAGVVTAEYQIPMALVPLFTH